MANLWCRDTFCIYLKDKLGYNPFFMNNLRECRFGAEKCRGAHTEDDIKPFSHIIKYNKTDKSLYNWVELYNDVIKVLKSELPKVINPEHKAKIIAINPDEMNFFENLLLWRTLACYYRKQSKDNKNISIPQFLLSDEDTAWCLSKTTIICEDYKRMVDMLDQGKRLSSNDVCLTTSLNCKNGVHEIESTICQEDFLEGKCSCIRLDEVIQNDIQNDIPNDDNEWNNVKSKKKKQPKKVEKQIRKIHYTDSGMIPFKIIYMKYREEQLALEEKLKEEVRLKEEQDSKLIVKKIVKLGAKK